MNHTGTVRLETERLILRRFKVTDAEEMYKNWASDEEVTKYLTWPPHSSADVTRALLEEWVKAYDNKDNYNWVIELKENGSIVGSIVVSIRENIREACLGYCLSRSMWGNGIMPEAGKAVIAHLFNEVGFNRIAAAHDADNPKSGRVMQKLGMTCEGTLRSAGYNNRGIIDEVWYSILASEA